MTTTMLRHLSLLCLLIALGGCATTNKMTPISQQSSLAYGKTLFQDGKFQEAMDVLLPVATSGNAEAQYSIGYMYYYGFGVAQDKQVGAQWIKLSAEKGYAPAKEALGVMQSNQRALKPLHTGE